MKLFFRVLPLLLLAAGTLTQDFDLSDAFDDPEPTPPKQHPTKKPKSDGGLDLGDALLPDDNPKPAKPAKPAVVPPQSGGGGGSFDDSDLADVGGGDYKPEGGHSGGHAVDPGSDTHGGGEQPQAGPMAGIISAIGVALVGAASSYFAYQKKKLCFKIQGGQDPESGKVQQGVHSDPQVYSDLLQKDRT